MSSAIDTLLEAARYIDLLEQQKQWSQQQQQQQQSVSVASSVSSGGNSGVIRASGAAGYIPVGSYVQLIASNVSPTHVTTTAANTGNLRIHNSNLQPFSTQNGSSNTVLISTNNGNATPANALITENNSNALVTSSTTVAATPVIITTATSSNTTAGIINAHNLSQQNHLPMRYHAPIQQQQQQQSINTSAPLNLQTSTQAAAAAVPPSSPVATSITTGAPTILTIENRSTGEFLYFY